MKNIICTILYLIVQMGLSILFTINGFGVDTWQWWALCLGIFSSYIIGMLRMVDFE